MIRKLVLLTAAVAAVAAAAVPSSADPVDDAVRTVQQVVGRDLPGGGIIVPPGLVHTPVVGYIQIVKDQAHPVPTFTTMGALSDPGSWTCTDNGAALPYEVTCLPVLGTVLDWKCDVLHADAHGLSEDAVVRTSLDCDGGATPPEAVTPVVTGATYQWTWSPSGVFVTEFSCTVDGGAGPQASGYFRAGCGDPGVPTVG